MATSQRAPRSDAASNRVRLIDVTLGLLAANAHSSMHDVAAAAGVGRVTLYNHFDSREALIEAVFQRQIARAEAALDLDDATLEPSARLESCVASSWQIMAGLHGLMNAAVAALGPERVREEHERLVERIEKIISAGILSGAFRSTQPARWLAEIYFDLVHGAAMRSDSRTSNSEPENQAARDIAEMLAHSMLMLVGAHSGQADGASPAPAVGVADAAASSIR